MERLNPSAFVLVHLSCKLWPVQNCDIHQQEREQDSLYLEFPDPSSLRGPDLPPFISILFISLPSHPVLDPAGSGFYPFPALFTPSQPAFLITCGDIFVLIASCYICLFLFDCRLLPVLSVVGLTVTASPAVPARSVCLVGAGAAESLCCRITACSSTANVAGDDLHLITASDESVRLVERCEREFSSRSSSWVLSPRLAAEA